MTNCTTVSFLIECSQHFCEMKSYFLILINILAIGVKLSSAIVLECDFVHHKSYWGLNYACIAKNLETTVEHRTITEMKGLHIAGKTNDDVQKFVVSKQKCPVLPLNVGQFFKNLEVFYVMKSGVNTLTNEDLKGLDKLKIFDVSHNPIDRIEKGYFNGKSSIKIISFHDCALKFVHSSALDPLVNLEEGHFQYNHCVDYRGDRKDLLPILKQHLENCNEKDEMDYEDGAEEVTTESRLPEVHYINECQATFMGRNSFFIISLLVLVIIVGIISFGFVLRKLLQKEGIESHRLNDDF